MKNYRLVFRQTDHDKFDEIANGRKTIETRAASVKYKAVQPGDSLTFVCGADTLTKTVGRVDHFPSLDEMFDALPLASIFPDLSDIEEARKIYHGFPSYAKKIETEGILAFSLEP